jgi:hypothetical protein
MSLGDFLEKLRPRVAGPTMTVLPDCKSVLVERPEPLPAVYCMELPTVESLLAVLGDVRRRMLPQVAETWPVDMRVDCVRDPRWSLWTDRLAGDVILHVRDARFGWLHYVITRDEARRFATAILAQLEAPPPAMDGKA